MIKDLTSGLKSLYRNRCRRSAARDFSHLTRGLRPGLTAKPPLRGWLVRSSSISSHREIAIAVATQSLKPSFLTAAQQHG